MNLKDWHAHECIMPVTPVRHGAIVPVLFMVMFTRSAWIDFATDLDLAVVHLLASPCPDTSADGQIT